MTWSERISLIVVCFVVYFVGYLVGSLTHGSSAVREARNVPEGVPYLIAWHNEKGGISSIGGSDWELKHRCPLCGQDVESKAALP